MNVTVPHRRVDVINRLSEMSYFLPERYHEVISDLCCEIEDGQHDSAVEALLRPSYFRKARLLARNMVVFS